MKLIISTFIFLLLSILSINTNAQISTIDSDYSNIIYADDAKDAEKKKGKKKEEEPECE